MESIPQKPAYEMIDDIIPIDRAEAIRSRALKESGWKLHEEWFFSQYDCSWVRRELGRPSIGQLDSDLAVLYRKGADLIESQFGAVVGNHFTVVAHKMTQGQSIGVHNDSPVGDRGRTENYRLLFYLDPAFEDAFGGHLILLKNRVPGDIQTIIRPNFNTGVLMALSETSLHAISRIRSSTRYSVVISYWAYPVLEGDPIAGAALRRCLQELIRSGFEDIPHSGTAFSWHLYNTYALLAEWGAPVEVRLAGLLHSVLGRTVSGVPPSCISDDWVRSEAGEVVYDLIAAFSDWSPRSLTRSTIDGHLALIHLANAIDQATSITELQELHCSITHAPVNHREAIDRSIVVCSDRLKARQSANPSGMIHRDN